MITVTVELDVELYCIHAKKAIFDICFLIFEIILQHSRIQMSYMAFLICHFEPETWLRLILIFSATKLLQTGLNLCSIRTSLKLAACSATYANWCHFTSRVNWSTFFSTRIYLLDGFCDFKKYNLAMTIMAGNSTIMSATSSLRK